MSDEKETCPACGSDRVTKGRILGGILVDLFSSVGAALLDAQRGGPDDRREQDVG